jgi:hypothetical protein
VPCIFSEIGVVVCGIEYLPFSVAQTSLHLVRGGYPVLRLVVVRCWMDTWIFCCSPQVANGSWVLVIFELLNPWEFNLSLCAGYFFFAVTFVKCFSYSNLGRRNFVKDGF